MQTINAETVSAVKQFAANGMFMQTDSGAVAFPGTDGDWFKNPSLKFDGTPNSEKLSNATDSIYVYLPNGMCAVLGIFDYQA